MTKRTTPADVPVAPVDDTTLKAAPQPLPGNPGRVDGGSAEDIQAVNFDDDEIYSGRGKNVRTGGTTNARGGDSGRLGAPAEQLSRTNEPRER